MNMSSDNEEARSLIPVLVITNDNRGSSSETASDFLSLVSFAEAQKKKKYLPKPRPALFYEIVTDDIGFSMPPYEAKLCSVQMKDLSGKYVMHDVTLNTTNNPKTFCSQSVQTTHTVTDIIVDLPPYPKKEPRKNRVKLERDQVNCFEHQSPYYETGLQNSSQFLSPSCLTHSISRDSVLTQKTSEGGEDFSASWDKMLTLTERDKSHTAPIIAAGNEENENGPCFDFQCAPECYFMNDPPGEVWGRPLIRPPYFPLRSPFELPEPPFQLPQTQFIPQQSPYLMTPDPFLSPELFSYFVDPFPMPMYWSRPFGCCPGGGDKTNVKMKETEDNCIKRPENKCNEADCNASECSHKISYDTCLSNLDISDSDIAQTTSKDMALPSISLKGASVGSTSALKLTRKTSLLAKKQPDIPIKPKGQINKYNTSSAPESKFPRLYGQDSTSSKSGFESPWSRALRSISENIAFKKLRQNVVENNSRKHAQSYTNKTYIMKAILSLLQEPKSSKTLSEALSDESSNTGPSSSSIFNYIFRDKLKDILSEILIERAEVQLHDHPIPALPHNQRQQKSFTRHLQSVAEQDMIINHAVDLRCTTRNMMLIPEEENTVSEEENFVSKAKKKSNNPECSIITTWTTNCIPTNWSSEAECINAKAIVPQLSMSSDSHEHLVHSCSFTDSTSALDSSHECAYKAAEKDESAFSLANRTASPSSTDELSQRVWYPGSDSCLENFTRDYKTHVDRETDPPLSLTHSFCNCDFTALNLDLPLHTCSCSNLNISKAYEGMSDEFSIEEASPSNECIYYETGCDGRMVFNAEQEELIENLYQDCVNVNTDHVKFHPLRQLANSCSSNTSILPQQMQYDLTDYNAQWLLPLTDDVASQAPTLFWAENDNLPRSCCSGSDIRLAQWEPHARGTAAIPSFNFSYAVHPALMKEPSGDAMNTKTCSCTNMSFESSSDSWESHY